MGNFKDLTGQKFQMLTVTGLGEPVVKVYNGKEKKTKVWICDCDCGFKGKRVAATEIKKQKSCGCLMSKEKRSERVKGENNPMFGKKGELSSNWDPDRNNEKRIKSRTGYEYKKWRKLVFERDGYTCKCCDKKSYGDIEAHHIYNYRDNLGLKTKLENGITLCKKCHSSFHAIYGKRNNDMAQLLDFFSQQKK